MSKVHIESTLKALKKFEQDIEHTTQRLVENTTAAMGRSAQSTRRFNDQTGNLRRSIESWTKPFHGFVRVGASYAAYVENGNGPAGGYIYPITKKVLRFQVNGETFFRRRVKVSVPRPFMNDALVEGQKILSKGLSAIVRDALTNYNKGS